MKLDKYIHVLLCFFLPLVTKGQTITTTAGNGLGSYSGDNNLVINAGIGLTSHVVFDSIGNYYFVTRGHHRVRKVSSSGIITTITGTGVAGYNGDSILAINAQINNPTGIAIDSIGNLYIADMYNHRIRRIDANSGYITTIAGNGIGNFSGDSGLANNASLSFPTSITFNKQGSLFISDWGNSRIRKVTPTGIISTYVGSGVSGFGGDSGQAIQAKLHDPLGLCFDSQNNLYISDFSNNRIRKVSNTGIITTFAGTGNALYDGDSILATNSSIWGPNDIAIGENNSIYIADYSNNRIRKVDTNNIITTIAGIGTQGYSGDSGIATLAKLYGPEGVSFDLCGNLYIADAQNKRIRKVWFNTDTLPHSTVGIIPNDTVSTGTQVTTTASVNTGTIVSCQWIKNGVATSTTTNSYTYTPVNGDSVYCIVTVKGCTGRMYTDTISAIHLTVTGDAGIINTTTNTTHTYPNPVTDVLHVTTTELQHYVLHNLMGVVVLQGSLDKQNSIDMKAIPSGIYLLQLTNQEGQRTVLRVVKE